MEPLPLYCHNCGAANAAENDICHACNHSLANIHEAEQPILLRERYRLLVQVGAGGYGAVYKAIDTLSSGNEIVAIKQINLYNLTPQEIIEATDAFNREVRILSGLRHPNLVRIHDTFTDAEHWYLVMDFIEGETLEEYLKKRLSLLQKGELQKGDLQQRGLPLEEVLAIGLQLCPVLDYLHTRQPQIIFRDLKPSNIMRTADGKLYLIDFGTARYFIPGKPKDTIPFGSPGYAAPEQYGRAQTTPQADIYSLGALLHQLLTGQDPSESPFRFEPLRPNDDSEWATLNRLIQQMVMVDASQRPASIGEVQEELERLAGIQAEPRIWRPSELPPPSVYTPNQTWLPVGTTIAPISHTSRRKFVVGGLVVGAAVLGLVSLPALCRSVSPPHFNGSIAIPLSPAPPLPDHLIFRGHSGPVTSVVWSPDGQYIASGSADKTVQVWRPSDGFVLYKFYGYKSPVASVGWSTNSMCIASSGDTDDSVQVWEALNGNMDTTHSSGHTGRVLSLVWSDDMSHIISGGEDKTVQIWDSTHGKTVFTYQGHSGSVKAVVNSLMPPLVGNNCVEITASAGADKTVQVWLSAEENHVGDLLTTYKGHTASVNALAVSQQRTHIASASDDQTVQVWDARTGLSTVTYRGHTGKVNAVVWPQQTQQFSYIISAGEDKTVQVWDSSTGRHIYTYSGHTAPVRTLTVLDQTQAKYQYPNRVISGSDDGTVHLWSIPRF